MITPPVYDLDVWTGESESHPTGGIDSPEALLEEMDRVGIDRALVYHITARTGSAKAGNDRLLNEIGDYPRLTPAWVVSPAAVEEYGSVDALIDAMDAAGVTAVRMFPGEHDYRLTDDAVDPLLTGLERANALLVLDALTSILKDGFTYEEVGELAAQHQHTAYDRPGLNVVLTQLVNPSIGGDFAEMEDIVEAVNGTTNLHIDTARFQIHDGARQFVDECGVDKLLFGSHLPHASAGAGLSAVLLSSLTREERRRVAGENLSELLGETARDWEAAGRAPVRSLKRVPYEIIDVHGHVRDESAPGETRPDADGIVEQMDRTGIALCCVSQTRGGPAGNDTAARAARRYPDRLVPFAVANPNWDDVRGELERCFDELGMRMIKIHPVIHDTPADDPAYDPVYEFADERECLVVTHARMDDEETERFRRVAGNYPNMTLMLYHAGRAWDRADNFVSVAQEHDNVLLEITFSYNVDGIIEYLVDQVGPERVFFGTDLGARAPESQVGWATYARMNEEQRRLHMRENGLRLLSEMDALPEAYRDER